MLVSAALSSSFIISTQNRSYSYPYSGMYIKVNKVNLPRDIWHITLSIKRMSRNKNWCIKMLAAMMISLSLVRPAAGFSSIHAFSSSCIGRAAHGRLALSTSSSSLGHSPLSLLRAKKEAAGIAEHLSIRDALAQGKLARVRITVGNGNPASHGASL
jgi:hypothetical protein